MATLIDLFLHLDAHLAEFVTAYGPWVYALLFMIIFAETGFVVTPFLPGDSLLFAIGALSAKGLLNPWVSFVLLAGAAVLGDATNYAIGNYIGPKVFTSHDSSSWLHRALNREHLDRAHAFFEKHGGKAIVLGQFMPIVRTFVPFVAGAGSMTYGAFAIYNVTAAVSWVGICTGAGYLFGNIPVVKENFSLVVLGIIAVSLIPMAVELIKSRRRAA